MVGMRYFASRSIFRPNQISAEGTFLAKVMKLQNETCNAYISSNLSLVSVSDIASVLWRTHVQESRVQQRKSWRIFLQVPNISSLIDDGKQQLWYPALKRPHSLYEQRISLLMRGASRSQKSFEASCKV